MEAGAPQEAQVPETLPRLEIEGRRVLHLLDEADVVRSTGGLAGALFMYASIRRTAVASTCQWRRKFKLTSITPVHLRVTLRWLLSDGAKRERRLGNRLGMRRTANAPPLEMCRDNVDDLKIRKGFDSII